MRRIASAPDLPRAVCFSRLLDCARDYCGPTARLGLPLTLAIIGGQTARFKPFVDLYRRDPGAVTFCERLLDLDEGMQEWRYRHVKMVERIIGARIGTGGSAGAEYLRSTLFRPAFPDLWAVRSV